jgi:hypothetical protein
MDQELLLAAIGDQLDALSGLISTTIGLALLAAWAGLWGEKKVALFSMSVERLHAFYILGASFITVNVTAIIYFLRLADILVQIDGAHLDDALTVLGMNPWPYNPFAYFGPSTSSVLHSGLGYGLLIVIWWIGYTALSLLVDYRTRRVSERLILYGFLAVGVLSMLVVQYVFWIIAGRVEDAAFPLDVAVNRVVRTAFSLAGIGAGGLIFCLARGFRARRAAEAAGEPLRAQPEDAGASAPASRRGKKMDPGSSPG